MLIFIAALNGCIDPVPPEFQYEEGLVFVEGFVATEPGASFVTLNESSFEFGFYDVIPITGAEVSFENLGTGQIIPLTELDDIYLPASNFKAEPGELWKLRVTIPGGRTIESDPERVLQPVPIQNLEVNYNPEIEFREAFGGTFVPGHEILVSFDDPLAEDNYYYWTYRTYENLTYCATCSEKIYRDGECVDAGDAISGFPYFFYECATACWRIRFPESIAIFNDRFSDGKSISKLPVGNILLYTDENMVVELQQLSLTPSAYQYYKVLKDILDNSSGLNAPPPAALVGNLFNPNDAEDFIFGRFTAAATARAALFIDRSNIDEFPVDQEFREPLFEPILNSPFPPPATTTIPCVEGRYRTAIAPELWEDR
jgi:hypothetical protein